MITELRAKRAVAWAGTPVALEGGCEICRV